MMTASYAQKDNWILYPTRIDFDAGPGYSPAGFSNPNLTQPYAVENSVFDDAGNLLFYIQNERIYDASGTSVATFSSAGVYGHEIGIAPVPGQCNAYCVFFIEAMPLATINFGYIEVFVGPNGAITTSGVTLIQNTYYASGGLTVSPKIPGTNGHRYIYVYGGNFPLDRYIMTENGVTFDQTITEIGGEDFGELELSPCGRYLAWWGVGGITIYNLVAGTVQQKPIDDITGLEFDHTCTKLYFGSKNAGIYKWEFTTPSSSLQLLPHTRPFSNSHLELGKNNLMYVVRETGNGGELWYLDTDTDFFNLASSEFVVHSNASVWLGTYTLPDQIDGEGDDLFWGVEPLVVNSWGINELPQGRSVTDPALPVFYNCAPMELLADYTGDAPFAFVEIQSVDAQTGLPLPFLSYSSAVDFSNGSVDIRCLEDAVNCDLFSNDLGRTFKITLGLENRCEKEIVEGYFKVEGAPVAVSDIGLTVGGNGPNCPASQDIANPCEAHTLYGSIDFTNAVGDITFYQVDIWEVDCSTGSTLTHLYQGPVVSESSTTGFNFNLNSFDIDPNTQGDIFFFDNNYINRCIKVSVEVGNDCGSLEDFSYIEFTDNIPLQGDLQALRLMQDGRHKGQEVSVFPNPFNRELTLAHDSALEGQGIFQLINMAGQTVYQQVLQAAPAQTLQLPQLPAGMYLYTWQSDSETAQSKLIRE